MVKFTGYATVNNCYVTNNGFIISTSASATACGNTKVEAQENATKIANKIAYNNAKTQADSSNQTIVRSIDCNQIQQIVYYHNINLETTTTIIDSSPVYIKYVTTFDIFSDYSLTNQIGNMKVEKDVFELSNASSDGIGPTTQAIFRHIAEFNPSYNPDGSVVFYLNLESNGITDYGMHDTPGVYFGAINGLQSSGKYINCMGTFEKDVPPEDETTRIVRWVLNIFY
jgi:hypothetical protein